MWQEQAQFMFSCIDYDHKQKILKLKKNQFNLCFKILLFAPLLGREVLQ